MEIPTHNDQVFTVSYLRLRRSIGWLGILLPVALALSTPLVNRGIDPPCPCPLSSISAYYYSNASVLMLGTILCFVFFLAAYPNQKEFERAGDWLNDGQITSVAALGLLAVAIVPMHIEDSFKDCVQNRSMLFGSWSAIHFGGAALFFSLMAYLSAFRFTRTDKNLDNHPKKRQRNGIYRLMAILMVVFMILIPILNFPWSLFFCETGLLWSFGFSFLVKGKQLGALND